MNFTIIVTSKCNLRCDYCYEENKKYQDMSVEVCDKTIDFIIKSIRARKNINESHKVVFHGGEPLLKFDLIRHIKERLDNELKYKYKISYMMTTNGTVISQEIINYIKENNIALSVSVDGTKCTHDKYRRFESGKGSYDIVYKNVAKLIQNEINIRCRLTYRSLTVSELYKGILELSSLGIKNFVPVADFYDTTWTKEDIDVLESEIDRMICDNKYKDLRVSMINQERLCEKQSDCFGGIVSFTISEDGGIYPCTFVIGNEKFRIGTVYNDDCIDKEYSLELFYERFEESEPCKTCSAKEYCMGNKCKLINYMANGKYYEPSIINCNLMSVNLRTYNKLLKGGELGAL